MISKAFAAGSISIPNSTDLLERSAKNLVNVIQSDESLWDERMAANGQERDEALVEAINHLLLFKC